MAPTIHALAESHIPAILAACSKWEELAQFGPPYWRPRSSAELRRKIAATAGPQPATEYTFVIATADAGTPPLYPSAAWSVNAPSTPLTGATATPRSASVFGVQAIATTATAAPVFDSSPTGQ